MGKLIRAGLIHECADISHLNQYRDTIVEMDGFRQKSYDNLTASIQTAPNTTLPKLAYGLGIARIGFIDARMFCREFEFDLKKMRHAQVEELVAADGIGGVLVQTWMDYFSSEKDGQSVDCLLKESTIESEQVEIGEAVFEGVISVITGLVEHFANCKELQEAVGSKGGKATDSVIAKTTYLINNDVTSNLSKNERAKELEVPITPEGEFL